MLKQLQTLQAETQSLEGELAMEKRAREQWQEEQQSELLFSTPSLQRLLIAYFLCMPGLHHTCFIRMCLLGHCLDMHPTIAASVHVLMVPCSIALDWEPSCYYRAQTTHICMCAVAPFPVQVRTPGTTSIWS